MASRTDQDGENPKGGASDKSGAEAGRGAQNPAWANGLKQLYDSVVDEPLPDSFNDLLAQLDDSELDEDGDDADPRKPSGGAA